MVIRKNRGALCAGIRFIISIEAGALALHRPSFGLFQAVWTASSGRSANRILSHVIRMGWAVSTRTFRTFGDLASAAQLSFYGGS